MSLPAGTGALLRLALRRDRLLLVWVLYVAVVPVALAASIAALYRTAAARQAFAEVGGHTAALVAFYGTLSGHSAAELASWRAGFVPVVVGLIALLTVIRHTRAEEEAGRRELLAGSVVGRQAALAAALLEATGATLAMALLLAAGMTLERLPLAGSLALGLQYALVGLLFAAVGAVAAQLTESASAARAVAVVVLAVTFVMRMGGDLSQLARGPVSWLSWVSPLGLLEQIRPYAQDRWWVGLVALAPTAPLLLVAVWLASRRDLGRGLLGVRPGPARAARWLRSPLGLAWRLQRGLLAGWVAGLAVTGLVVGAITKSIGQLLSQNRALAHVFAHLGGSTGLVNAYLAAMMSLLGIIVSSYAIQALLRLRAEEVSGHAEPVLASATTRGRWAASHLSLSLLGPAAALLAAGLGVGLGHGLETGHPAQELLQVLPAAAVQLPAVWVLTGVTMLLVGALPRWAALSWAALALCLLLSLVGTALQLNQSVLGISPFAHVPLLPGGSLALAPLAWLALIAALLAAAGIAALERRAIPTP